MTIPLPVGQYYTLSDSELADFDILQVNENEGMGYMVTGDFTIPDSKHEFFQELCPLPERIVIHESELSSYQTNLLRKYNGEISNPCKSERLSLNVHNKKNYTVYYKLLKYFCSLGVVIDKIANVIRYKEEAFLKSFVYYHTKKRTESKNEAVRNFHEACVNSCFGNFLMQKEKYRDHEICRDSLTALKLVSKSEFQGFPIIDDCTSLIDMKKKTVLLDRFPSIGTQILELSKLHFYKAWYGVIKPYFGDRVKLQSFDTDSYIMLIESEDPYTEMSNLKLDGENLLDFSNFPPEHPLYNNSCEGKLGLLKSEIDDKTAVEFVSLAQKVYSFRLQNDHDQVKCKGIPRKRAKKLCFEDFKHCLFTQKIKKVKLRGLRSFRQTIYQLLQNKIALSAICTCRYFLPPHGIRSLPFEHYTLRNSESETIFV